MTYYSILLIKKDTN